MSTPEPLMITRADLRGSVLRDVDLSGSRIEGADLYDVVITGDLRNVVINGVDVAPYVEAELDRRDPVRPLMRPTDADGFRAAWRLIGDLWAGTVERARALDPDLLHESVDGEWSFIETLRHLAFASESWIGRCVLGNPSPWHAISLPWDQMPDTPGVPRDRTVRPTLDEALAVRDAAAAMVDRVIDTLTDPELDRETDPCVGPGWPRAGAAFPVRDCLLVVLNEEYYHRLYAERDLALLEAPES